ncbi:MAG: von Willebrand factor type A domain-containing protein [Bacteroidales bacterium]|nr:von Willebrand factor type A domain-containing protein [Bacteroidales bacterium]MDD4218498.1 von Willebrand factor type A domain-containing protein [Bacteroidales bacterium]
MKTKIFLIGIFLMLFASILFSATIEGSVSDNASGNSISDAEVKLYKMGIIIRTVKTDNIGMFKFDNLDEGPYNVRVNVKGYSEFFEKNIILGKNDFHRMTIFMIAEVLAVQDNTNHIILDATSKDEKPVSSVSLMHKSNSGNRSYFGTNSEAAYDDVYVQHNTESYDFIQENGFKAVLNDPLSTFSIDVDRAAYANVRRFINNSQMPYADAVRIEEMINYFDYDYENPQNEHPFGTHLELGNCPWNKNSKLLMIGIQGEEMETENIPACNLVFLIDVSGSMNSDNKLGLLKKSFRLLVDKLRPEDKVSIVVYAGAAGCVLPSTRGKDKTKILAALDGLAAGGSTAGGAGIKLAYQIAVDNFIKGGNNRVILATDGDFNIGASSDGEMERLIEKKRDLGIYLTVLGFGMGNYKDSKMEKLSNKGNGNYAYIDNIMEANKIFGQELWGTLYTIAKDVKIQIEFNPNKVKEYRLIGYENRMLNKEDFNDDKKDAGEIGSGHTVTAIYEIVLAEGTESSDKVDPLNYQTSSVVKSNDIMTLKIRYKKPDQDFSRLITEKVTVRDLKKSENSKNFMLAVSVAEFGMLLRDSEFKGSASYDHVLLWAKRAKGEDTYGYVAELITLVERTKLLAKL